MKDEKKGLIAEFKEFIARGSVMDLAVGIIIGGAFTAIVNSLVNDIVMPVITRITGGNDFSGLNIALAEGEEAPILGLGNFVGSIINFLLIALVVFIMVKAVNKFKRKEEEEAEAEPTTKICPKCQMEISIKATKCPHCTSDIE